MLGRILAYMLGGGAAFYLAWHALQRDDRQSPPLTTEPEGWGQGIVWYQYREGELGEKIAADEVYLLPAALDLRQIAITKDTDSLQAVRAKMKFSSDVGPVLAIFASSPAVIRLQEKVKLETAGYVLRTDEAVYDAGVITGQSRVTVTGQGISLNSDGGFSYHPQSGQLEFIGETEGEIDAKLP